MGPYRAFPTLYWEVFTTYEDWDMAFWVLPVFYPFPVPKPKYEHFNLSFQLDTFTLNYSDEPKGMDFESGTLPPRLV